MSSAPGRFELTQAPLAKLAEVRPGYVFRPGVAVRIPVQVHQLRVADFGDDGLVSCTGVERDEIEADHFEQHRVLPGDLILCTREVSFRAAMVPGPAPDAVAGGQMVVIRVNDHRRIMPAFLAWWLNRPAVARLAKPHATGSYNRVIPTAFIRSLEVPLPSLVTQSRIIEVETLRLREKELMTRLAGLRAELVDNALQRLIGE